MSASSIERIEVAGGPDEVHRNQIGRLEIKRYRDTDPALSGGSSDVLMLAEAERMASEGLWPKPTGFDA
jgi:acyl-CoA dehydrogenase